MSDTPVRYYGCCGWIISSPAGRQIVIGHAFDENRGYRVTLKFSDSVSWNSLSVEAAMAVVRTLREQEIRNADAGAIAIEIERWAHRCERLNTGWALLGSPTGGFDAAMHGNA